MTVSRTITVKWTLEKTDEVTLTLAFVPQNAKVFESVFPIAWKVLKISDKGSSPQLTWNDNSGGSRVDIDLDTSGTISDEFEIIPLHNRTNLQLDTARHPPSYYFSTPETSTEPNQALVVNRTNQHVNIGAGYITGSSPDEDFTTVLVWRDVLDGNTVDIHYAPILTIWANLPGVEESQLLASLPNVSPLCQGDLSKTADVNVTFEVSRTKQGGLVCSGPSPFKAPDSAASVSAIAVSAPAVSANAIPTSTIPATTALATLPGAATETEGDLIYTADLSFATPVNVSGGVTAIKKMLSSQGYSSFKVTYKEWGAEARLRLALPSGATLKQAETDLVAAIGATPTNYGKAFVKNHGGAVLLSYDNAVVQKWIQVSPASPEWFEATQQVAAH
ncbi:hypothetical protein C8Q79DRAFT_1015135 [Trametes meyenii]|nr:hypothetical protein C8Q79DRAFT_1015135 [Trametes meyenii]